MVKMTEYRIYSKPKPKANKNGIPNNSNSIKKKYHGKTKKYYWKKHILGSQSCVMTLNELLNFK